jgi:acetate kinase
MHTILVINCGSSSIKFAVIRSSDEQTLISGLAERLGSDQATISYKVNDQKHQVTPAGHDHNAAMEAILQAISQADLLNNLSAVGHRVVHGGEHFSDSQVLDKTALEELKQLNHLAPLHNPVNILGIEAAMALLPNLPQVAVFDTAFHQSIAQKAYLYGVPFSYYTEHAVRRYGFHGTSYRYVSARAAQLLDKPLDTCCFLAAHLGNGCSAAAIVNGKSADSSMGMTPIEGLIMGTRCGDIDPGLHAYLCERLNITLDQLMSILNKKSGLLGLSGVSNDMREIKAAAGAGNPQAAIALEVFAFHIARYLGALAISLPHIDGLIFTGGIGENDADLRAAVINQMGILGFKLDATLNQQAGDACGRITLTDSTLAMVVATNEELMIAKDAARLVKE